MDTNYILLKDKIEQFSYVTYRTSCGSTKLMSKNMLLISHTLVRGGAPIVLKEIVPYFQKEYNIIFISMEDGDLRDEFLQLGIDIHIGNSVNFAGCGYEFWNKFDLVFLNTIVSYTFLPLFINRKVPVIWWLHEPEVLFKNTYGRIIHFSLLSPNIRILSVTHETAVCVKKYYGVESTVLHMGLEDKYIGEYKETEDKIIRFFMPAKFQLIKGQDILAQAILGLPSEYLAKAEFIFAGGGDTEQPEYYELISKLSIALPSVIMLGEISKETVYEWYQKVDCVLAPSRADATPTTIVEGMMFNKLCVCSSKTGISKYMVSGRDGYVFPAEDSNTLRDLLIYIIDNYENLDEIRSNGRKIYIEYFERKSIEKQLSEIILELTTS